MRRLLTVLVLAFAAVAGVVTPAQAHNVLIGSDPKDKATLSAAPERVTLEFDQPVRQGFTQVTVTGPGGARFDEGGPSVDRTKVSVALGAPGPAGEYVIGYRILSSDGHPVSGSLTFTTTTGGTGTGQPAAAAPAASPVGGSGQNDLSAQATEASQNAGAGMAVLWIVLALVLLGAATAVALRRGGRPAPTGPSPAAPGTTETPGTPGTAEASSPAGSSSQPADQ
ncbi:hypothetical protein Misp01_29250 [Microtetraspora sp. NBRC 13810]|uniref:copper resistance CopC family protein n=1 Tax=Microtetraspora sp. NBRC 13810 TaxID=3030990 RepID=UPI0024A47389|nr:copper resistance CopC family protein [Microtetraspora sp. NBRC 13810]GLW07795.1 hypothetical protein Misp01_29250 [Microtetraspora sp. NBRC 13810]